MRHVFPLFVLLLGGCAPLFTVLDDTKTDAAAAMAEQLLVFAKTWSSRNGKQLDRIDNLALYSEDGERALFDPWGQKFRFCYVTEPETQKERLVIWTTDPQSGRIVAAPRHLAGLIDTPK